MRKGFTDTAKSLTVIRAKENKSKLIKVLKELFRKDGLRFLDYEDYFIVNTKEHIDNDTAGLIISYYWKLINLEIKYNTEEKSIFPTEEVLSSYLQSEELLARLILILDVYEHYHTILPNEINTLEGLKEFLNSKKKEREV